MATVGIFFLRETKKEVALKNLYTEIYPENMPSLMDAMRNEQDRDIESNSKQGPASVIFNHILNELGGVGKEDNSKMGTLAGSPRAYNQKLDADFNNAPLFENVRIETLDEEDEQDEESS